MITQVLFITGNMEFAVSIKAALERTGAFEVHPFSQVDAAYEYLIDNPHDVAIIDFTIPDMRVDVVVDRLRSVHPFLAIVATPRQPDEVIRLLRLQNSINVPFTARAIIPLLDKAAADAKRLMALPTKPIDSRHPEPQPSDDDTPVIMGDGGDDAASWQQVQKRELEDAEFQEILNTIDPNAPPAPSKTQKGDFDNLVNSMRKDQTRQPLPTRQQQYVDLILKGGVDQPSEQSSRTPTPGETPVVIEQDKRNPFKQREAPPSPPARSEEDSRRVFRKLAEEEPPMPSFEELEESGTVTDLFVGVNDSSFKSVMSILRGEEPVEAETPSVQTDDFFNPVDSAHGEQQPTNWNAPPIDLPEAGAFFDKAATDAPSQEDYLRPAAMYDFDAVKPVEDDGHRDVSDIPARKILEETLDDSKWLDSFSLEELIANIERQLPSHKPRVQPLPSWIKESNRKRDPRHPRGVLPLPPETAEPEFLDRLPSASTPTAKAPQPPPSDLPEMPPVTASDALSLSERFADQATQLSKAQDQVPPDVQSMETEWLQAPPRPRTPREMFQRQPPSAPTKPEVPDSFPEPLPDSMADIEAFREEVLGEAPFGEEEGVTTQQFADTARLADVWESVSPFIMEETDAEADAEAEDDLLIRDAQGYEAQESEAFALPRFNTEEFNTEFERLAAFDFAREVPVEDPYLAQLALSMTQVSLELTADATLLTREAEQGAMLVAFAGRMASEDIEDLHQMIANDWTVNGDDARIRFISLPNSGKDYMLYSRRTVDGLILSLVFAGATPLRDIRQQGRRLVDALESVPEPGSARITTSTGTISVVTATGSQELAALAESESAPSVDMEPPPDLGPTAVYACVWVIRENEKLLDDAAARAIMTGLRLQLREQYWRVQDLQARGNYVYLLADIPGETPPFMIIRDLKRRSAEIARKQHPSISENLWADSYLVVTPGRPLDEEEIQQFINFERMSLT